MSGTIPADASLKVEVIDKGSDNYGTLTEPVKTHTILGVYDISLDRDLGKDEAVQLSFSVDAGHNGKEAVVLHYAERDGKTYLETYHSTVTDGTVAIEVTGFSPYVIALNDAGANTVDEGKKPPSPESKPGNDTLPTGNEDEVQDGINTMTGNDLTSGKNTALTDSKSDVIDAAGEGDSKIVQPSEEVKIIKNDGRIKASKTADESQALVWVMLLFLASGLVVFSMKQRKNSK